MGKIGIMGGAFGPVHNGRLHLGRRAYMEYGLDRIWYMPAGQPPHRKDHHVMDVIHRYRMLELALEKKEGFVFPDFEVHRDGYTYTARTLALLKETYPEHESYFVLGADSLCEIEGRYHPELVTGTVDTLAASQEYDRGGHQPMEEQVAYLNEKYGSHIQMFHYREVDTSSEEIREMAVRGKPAGTCVPGKVADYIWSHKLYRGGESRMTGF